MRKAGCFVQKNILNDQAFQRLQCFFHVMRIGITLGDVLALDI